MTPSFGHPVIDDVRRDIPELVELLGQLVRCFPTYGSQAQEKALSIAGRLLASAGFTVTHSRMDIARLKQSPLYVNVAALGSPFEDYERSPRPSLAATREFSVDGPRIVLNGHIDVEFVTAPAGWRTSHWASGHVTDGRVYGRGTSDMLGGVACYLYVLNKLSSYFDDARGSLTVQMVLDEEVGGNGTLWQLLTHPGPIPDLALIAEPTDRMVCRTTRGFHQFSVVCEGAPVHMAFAREFDNANRALPEIIGALEALNRQIQIQLGRDTSSRFVMYGSIRGGTDAAVPADSATVDVTLALPPELSALSIEQELERALSEMAGAWPGRPTLKSFGLSFPGSDVGSEFLEGLLMESAASLGAPLSTGEFPSACDARLFQSFGIPVLVYGPGNLSRAHGSDEYITIEELEDYSTILATCLLELWARS